ncbi:hypothetical protein EJ04DRAFT_120041 [Polyplosphaeria fusca]|uniref:Uncharacterized protein n=1 Tax=Polyplosphaeria fusca TaxID=682080 RepID=A0A9P4UVB2_9PLEO|nr:hypothetical protein EJ04DRAFT_120041 [Polyplosphaeria fusca]
MYNYRQALPSCSVCTAVHFNYYNLFGTSRSVVSVGDKSHLGDKSQNAGDKSQNAGDKSQNAGDKSRQPSSTHTSRKFDFCCFLHIIVL